MRRDDRIEQDSLGQVQVPTQAYYGAQTQRAVTNFAISGIKPYPAFIWSMSVIKRAAAEVNRDLGLLDPRIANAIARAAQEVIEGQHNDQFVVDPFQAGAGTSHNMNVNEIFANRAIELLGGQRGDYTLGSPIIVHSLFEMMHVLIGAIKAFTNKCVRGLQANRDKAEGWLAKNAILVTALNPVIGYSKGAEVAKEAMATGRTIQEVVIAKGYLSAKQADQLLNTERMTGGGIQSSDRS